jgi:ankyrin repeat domain-containing protein 17
MGLVQLLVDRGGDVQARKTSDGTTPLHYAAHLGDVPMATLLLDKGGDVNAAKTHRGVTPLHLAAEKGHLGMAQLLIARGADVNAARTPEGGGHTVLMVACLNSHAPIVALLIEAGVDVDAQAQTPGATRALNWAINVGNVACVQLLLGAGKAAVNFRFGPHLERSLLDTTPSSTIASLLCDAGADINTPSPTTGYTPLCTAVEEGNVPLARLFLDRGASVHHRTGAGLTPLLLAATTDFSVLLSGSSSGTGTGAGAGAGGVSPMVKLLVERGADVNASIPRCGTTPLMGACANGDTSTARYLLRHGADRAVFNASGLDALAQIHKKRNTDELVTLLKH